MRNRSAKARVIGARHPDRRPWYDMCCWPECDGESVDESVPLCLRHHMSAWRSFEKMALWPLEQLRREFAGIEEPPTPRPRRNTESLVYFIRLGNRVKIGYTTNLGSRLASLPYEQVLGVVPGTFQDENRCHKLFAHLRTAGEWFRAEPELLEFIAKMAKPYVPPTPPRPTLKPDRQPPPPSPRSPHLDSDTRES